ncbi:MAG: hypothetical protein O7F73_18880 [Gammaproteobacteria bacterium]|nr:hypothetical protein [Gammaproteobacteria bacterium]
MTGDELQAFVKDTEVIFNPTGDNVYEFPTGRKLSTDEVSVLLDLEKWEKVLSEW